MKVHELISELMKLPAGIDVRCVSKYGKEAGEILTLDNSEINGIDSLSYSQIIFENDNEDA